MNSSLTLSESDPVCLLPPELALQVVITRYILTGGLGALIWEILNNIPGDYKLLSKYRLRLPTVVYLISKVSSLAFVIASTIFGVRPAYNCRWLDKGLDALYSLAVLSTSLLFFFRTRAIFNRNPWIVAFFAGLWLAVVAACMMTITGIEAMNIGPTKYCTIGEIKSYAPLTTIIPLINDTLVFLAITWRLSCNSYGHNTLKSGIRALVFGDSLPVLSKAMLQDGQAYYLTTIAVNLITSIMLCNRSGPEMLRPIFVVPNVALMNTMACRVFKKTRLGDFRETEICTTFLSKEIRFTHNKTTTPPPGEVESGGRTKQEGDATSGQVDSISVIRTVERTHNAHGEGRVLWS